MKQATGVSTSLSAIFSALATLGCCLPLSFATALGTSTASIFLYRHRLWLLGLSVVLIGLGFWQQHRAKQCAAKGRLLGNILLWSSVMVVGGMILFPGQIAAVIAALFWESQK